MQHHLLTPICMANLTIVIWIFLKIINAQKMKFSIEDLFSKCDQIRKKLRIWSHLLKKSSMENFFFVQCMNSKWLQFLDPLKRYPWESQVTGYPSNMINDQSHGNIIKTASIYTFHWPYYKLAIMIHLRRFWKKF